MRKSRESGGRCIRDNKLGGWETKEKLGGGQELKDARLKNFTRHNAATKNNNIYYDTKKNGQTLGL